MQEINNWNWDIGNNEVADINQWKQTFNWVEEPYVSPDGRPTMIRMSGNELRERFDKK